MKWKLRGKENLRKKILYKSDSFENSLNRIFSRILWPALDKATADYGPQTTQYGVYVYLVHPVCSVHKKKLGFPTGVKSWLKFDWTSGRWKSEAHNENKIKLVELYWVHLSKSYFAMFDVMYLHLKHLNSTNYFVFNVEFQHTLVIEP